MTFKLTNTASQPDSGDTQLVYNAKGDESTQDVKLIYPAAENNFRVTVIVMPQGSKFHAGAHWHEDYDEVLRVLKGCARIRVGNEYRIATPEDGEMVVPKGIVHDVMRADFEAKPGEGDDGEVWLEERSDPVDGSKELFFRHAFSIAADKGEFGWKLPLQMFLLFMHTDNYMHLVPGPASWYFTHALHVAVRPVALWLGLKPFYEAYTPAKLNDVARTLESGGKMKRE